VARVARLGGGAVGWDSGWGGFGPEEEEEEEAKGCISPTTSINQFWTPLSTPTHPPTHPRTHTHTYPPPPTHHLPTPFNPNTPTPTTPQFHPPTPPPPPNPQRHENTVDVDVLVYKAVEQFLRCDEKGKREWRGMIKQGPGVGAGGLGEHE